MDVVLPASDTPQIRSWDPWNTHENTLFHHVSSIYPYHIHIISISYPYHIHIISISYPYHIPHPAIPNATGGRECGRAHESPAERRQRREPGCDANATERGFPVFPPSFPLQMDPSKTILLGYISTSRNMQGVNDLKLLDDGSYGYFFFN